MSGRLSEVRRAREGYLVIADITGYTRFLTGTELEHAQLSVTVAFWVKSGTAA